MSTITKKRAQEIFLGNGPEPTASEERELARIALASLEAEAVAYIIQDAQARGLGRPGFLSFDASISDEDINEYEISVTPLYTAPQLPQPAVAVPLAIHDEDFEKALSVLNDTLDDCGDSERGLLLALDKAGIEVRSDACRAAMLQGADGKPELTVWYGSMPETNGKTNWTAMLHRKGQHPWEGITIERSEHPDRVRYKSDRMRHLIGELSEEPDILEYDADAHSGYVKPGNSPVISDSWISCSERMPNDKQYVWCWGKSYGWTECDTFEGYYDWSRNKWWAVTDDGEEPASKVTHWMPLPEPPQGAK